MKPDRLGFQMITVTVQCMGCGVKVDWELDKAIDGIFDKTICDDCLDLMVINNE